MRLQPPDDSINSAQDKQPNIDERVIVITPRFRYVGYLDAAQIWRYAVDGQPIENVIEWTRSRGP